LPSVMSHEIFSGGGCGSSRPLCRSGFLDQTERSAILKKLARDCNRHGGTSYKKIRILH
jgi:hypothetical protein